MPKSVSRWLYDAIVESTLSLEDGIKVLEHVHPSRECEVHIRRLDGLEQAGQLSIQVTVCADDIQSAEKLADEELDKFLRLLSFVTTSPYRFVRKEGYARGAFGRVVLGQSKRSQI